MEAFIIIAMMVGLFVSGISLGAFLENKRLYSVKLVQEINESLKETRQILLPLADKITHLDTRHEQFLNHILVDHVGREDPESTLKMPVYKYGLVTEELNLKEEQWRRKQES
jgi:hypothetical protein